MENKKAMHLGVIKEDLGRYAFLPGSPERAAKIAKHFDNPQEVAFNREFRTFSGTLDGVKVSVTSTGIGGPSTAIAIEELYEYGVDTMMRIGTCASLSETVSKGDILLPRGAVKMEGTSDHYLPMEFPAVPSFDMMNTMFETINDLGFKVHTDVSITKSSFHSQTKPNEQPVSETLNRKWSEYLRGGATTTSMECSVLFSVTQALGIRGASVLVSATDYKVFDNQKPGDSYDIEEKAIKAGVESMRRIIQKDLDNN